MASSEVYLDVLSQIEEKSLPPRLKREFHVCNEDNGNGGPVVRIMQWNMLAQALCHGSDNFVLCPKDALAWENRKLRVLEELLQYSPDIICLQEVDRFEFVKDNLQKAGYEGVFFPKPESPCLDFEHHTGPDGCAIFHSVKKIKFITGDSVILKDDSYLTNQVSIINTFGLVGCENPCFTVAVTHLKAKPPYSQLRLRQGSFLLRYVEQKVGSSPVIICGDFNADPQEPIYSAFKESPMNLESASTYLSDTKSEPPYTTWKIRGGTNGNKESCKTIDYVWFSNHFHPQKVLEIPRGEQLGENKLPSFSFPSDHLSLVCDFQLTC